MADSTSIAQYATERNSITGFSGHYTAYTRNGLNWFSMTQNKAYFNGIEVAFWQNQLWYSLPAMNQFRAYRNFIIRQMTLSTTYIKDKKPFVLFKDDNLLPGNAALAWLRGQWSHTGNLQERIKLAEQYSRFDRTQRLASMYHLDAKTQTIKGIKLPKEILLDMFLINHAEALNVAAYFLPKNGTIKTKNRSR